MNAYDYIIDKFGAKDIFIPDTRYEGPSAIEIINPFITMKILSKTLQEVRDMQLEAYNERQKRSLEAEQYCAVLNQS